MIILVDMDGVLSDFEREFFERWQKLYPDSPTIDLEKRTSFHLSDQYPEEYREKVSEVYHAPGFYRSLPVVPGGKEALENMRKLGHEIFLCTTPLTRFENCVQEKYEWVEEHLGMSYVKKLIITKDKTLVSGDILIDDNPTIEGVMDPQYEHILYDRAYNRHVQGKRRITWENWEEVI